MQKITSYVDTTRVHWLVEELQAMGVSEIMVTEYFKPLSRVSRLEFLCQDTEVANAKRIVHRVGTAGGPPPDHDIIVSHYDPEKLHLLPMSVRLNPLEESRLKQLITNMFAGVSKRLSLTFTIVVISILCVALILLGYIEGVQHSAAEANRNVWLITDATHQIEKAHLDQLIAAERLHRGDTKSALDQAKRARDRVAKAERVLIDSRLFDQAIMDSLRMVEHQFQSVTEDMYKVIVGLADAGTKGGAAQVAHLSMSHNDIMANLDALYLQNMQMLVSVEKRANDFWAQREAEAGEALSTMKLLLTGLTASSILVTLLMWVMARRKVSRPFHMLVEEGKTLDMEGLK